MVNENNINKYGKECYKEAYQLIQKYRNQDLMIIKDLRGATGIKLADAKIVIEDIRANEEAYRLYLFEENVVGSIDTLI